MAALYKRDKSPFWWMTWTIGGRKSRESTGIRHDGRKTPPDAAKDILRNLEDRLARQRFGLELPPQLVSLKDFMESYSATLSGRAATLAVHRGAMERFKEWAAEEGLVNLMDVDRSAACKFMAYRLDGGAKHITVKTQNVSLSMMMDEARRRNHVRFTENPFRIKIKVESAEKEPFTTEQVQAMFTMTAPQWMHTAMRICLSTGARIGSVVSLKWEDVDLEAGSMLFTVSKKGQYTVPMSDELIAYLRLIKRDVGSLFPELAGRSGSYQANAFSRLVEDNCKFQANWHRFRHTWVTAMQAKGVPMRVAMTLADHSTQDIHEGYAHTRAIEMRGHIKDISLFPKCVQNVS